MAEALLEAQPRLLGPSAPGHPPAAGAASLAPYAVFDDGYDAYDEDVAGPAVPISLGRANSGTGPAASPALEEVQQFVGLDAVQVLAPRAEAPSPEALADAAALTAAPAAAGPAAVSWASAAASLGAAVAAPAGGRGSPRGAWPAAAAVEAEAVAVAEAVAAAAVAAQGG